MAPQLQRRGYPRTWPILFLALFAAFLVLGLFQIDVIVAQDAQEGQNAPAENARRRQAPAQQQRGHSHAHRHVPFEFGDELKLECVLPDANGTGGSFYSWNWAQIGLKKLSFPLFGFPSLCRPIRRAHLRSRTNMQRNWRNLDFPLRNRDQHHLSMARGPVALQFLEDGDPRPGGLPVSVENEQRRFRLYAVPCCHLGRRGAGSYSLYEPLFVELPRERGVSCWRSCVSVAGSLSVVGGWIAVDYSWTCEVGGFVWSVVVCC